MKNKSNTMILLGLLLIAAALLLCGANFAEAAHAEQTASKAAASLTEQIPPATDYTPNTDAQAEIPDYLLNPDMPMPSIEIDNTDYTGILSIAALDLELPVISTCSYSKLKIAPCCYAGSAYTDNLVIAGHNYAAHFGHLKNLHTGDTVTFTDTDGNLFTYLVADMEVLASTAIDEMTNSNWDLTLFTCTVGGQNRIAIRCQKVE